MQYEGMSNSQNCHIFISGSFHIHINMKVLIASEQEKTESI